jgi:hypothetical protein
MPVPQENLFIVEQASCLLLTIVQYLSCIVEQASCLLLTRNNRQPYKSIKLIRSNRNGNEMRPV